jgi:hypothetical protein
MNASTEHWWNDVDRRKPGTLRKTDSDATLSISFPTMDWPGIEVGPNRLSHGTTTVTQLPTKCNKQKVLRCLLACDAVVWKNLRRFGLICCFLLQIRTKVLLTVRHRHSSSEMSKDFYIPEDDNLMSSP